jgi:cytochrome c oxidase subunit 2
MAAWIGLQPGPAAAIPAPKVGEPVDGAIDLQGGATVVSAQIHEFHSFLLAIIASVTVLVLALLLWVMVRYNRRANPTPRTFSHNTLVEIIWTVVPVLILVAIATKSFPLLALEEHAPKTALTIKATGNKWYWSYEYPDQGVSFDSNVLTDKEAAAQNRPYLLAVDEPIVVPTGVNVQMIIASNDVIHSWSVPSFGVKQDAIPGRVNQTWFNVDKPGVYFGQCSQLCGLRHAFMPIEVHAVTPAEFAAWIARKGGKPAVSAAAAPPAEPAATPSAAPPQPSAAPSQPTNSQH